LEDSERETAERAAKGIAKCNTALSGLEGIREPRTKSVTSAPAP